MRLRTGVYECGSARVEVCDLISYFVIYRRDSGPKRLALSSALTGELRGFRRRK